MAESLANMPVLCRMALTATLIGFETCHDALERRDEGRDVVDRLFLVAAVDRLGRTKSNGRALSVFHPGAFFAPVALGQPLHLARATIAMTADCLLPCDLLGPAPGVSVLSGVRAGSSLPVDPARRRLHWR
jgi:hypothetical protein